MIVVVDILAFIGGCVVLSGCFVFALGVASNLRWWR